VNTDKLHWIGWVKRNVTGL